MNDFNIIVEFNILGNNVELIVFEYVQYINYQKTI